MKMKTLQNFINGKFVCKPNITLTIELKNPTIQVAGGLFDFFKKLKTTRQEHTTSTNIIKKNESITLYSGICKPFNDILQRMTVYCEPLSSYFNYFECSNGYGKLGNKQRLPPTKLECKIKTQKGGKRRFTRRKTRKLK